MRRVGQDFADRDFENSTSTYRNDHDEIIESKTACLMRSGHEGFHLRLLEDEQRLKAWLE